MVTPLSEWYDNKHKPKNQTLFDFMCEGMEEGEMSSLTWEQTLHADPPAIMPEELKQLCIDVWDDYLLRMEDILGNLDIDWEYAAMEYRKYIIKVCESQQDEALDQLARMEREKRKDFQRFKGEVDQIVQNPCQMGLNRLRQMTEWRKQKIKEHTKMLNYIEAQLKTLKKS